MLSDALLSLLQAVAQDDLAVILRGPVWQGPASDLSSRAFVCLSLLGPDTEQASQGVGEGGGAGGEELEGKALGKARVVLGPGPEGQVTVSLRLPHLGYAGGWRFCVALVPVTAVAAVCRARAQQISPEAVLDSGEAQTRDPALRSLVQQLVRLREDAGTPQGAPERVDPVKDLGLQDPLLQRMYQRQGEVEERIARSSCWGCVKLGEHYATARRQRQLEARVRELRAATSDAALAQLPDFEQRVAVLQNLGYVDEEKVVQLKGRVACEMNSADELLASELLFHNYLDVLSASEAVALLSAFVFQQKDASPPELPPSLEEAKASLLNLAWELGDLQRQFGIQTSAEEYAAETLNFGLMEVVLEWANGVPFSEICKLTNVPEGTIVRTIVRLDETCREFRGAARIVGNASLISKMDAASQSIKRDIVFAASLYVS